MDYASRRHKVLAHKKLTILVVRMVRGMFNKTIRGETSMDLFRRVNNVSVRCGYIVHPDCYTIKVEEYFKDMEYNPNSTFYKTWEDADIDLYNLSKGDLIKLLS